MYSKHLNLSKLTPGGKITNRLKTVWHGVALMENIDNFYVHLIINMCRRYTFSYNNCRVRT